MPGRIALFSTLIAVNLIVYGSYGWLANYQPDTNSRDPYLETSFREEGLFTRIDLESTLRNAAYTIPYFKRIEREQQILAFGTSESVHHHNVAHQLNALLDDPPKFRMYAQPGLSPIHLALVFAKCQQQQIRMPPILLSVNLVYFTESHDGVNDGWLSNVSRSDLFVELDHDRTRQHLTEDAQAVFSSHFEGRRWLYPLTLQKYLSNLLFLKFHQTGTLPEPDVFREKVFTFDGEKHPYNLQQNVWDGYRASDELQKSRWEVVEPQQCANLAGVRSIIDIAEKMQVPMLVVINRPNRKYYESHGLDMNRYDERYGEIRQQIRAMAGETIVLDLYDGPLLEPGYRDRMHPDEWGDFQIAEHMVATPELKAFRNKVREYYSMPPSSN